MNKRDRLHLRDSGTLTKENFEADDVARFISDRYVRTADVQLRIKTKDSTTLLKSYRHLPVTLIRLI